MKILYGVQATGNGHISRARAMGKYLAKAAVQVDYLFSGRDAAQLFDMQQFGQFQVKRGLTFVTEAGRVNYWQSVQQASLRELRQDINSLDVSSYDLVLTDFEPITAHAARRAGKRSVAIGHQYAFLHAIPQCHNNFVTQMVFKHFAPAQMQLGLHWHHFNQPILPPIIDEEPLDVAIQPQQVLVYLPFEDQQQVLKLLKPLTGYQFCVYGPGLAIDSCGHISTHPPALAPFKADLASCSYVLSNAGFELISEALQLGKTIMVKPLQGQMEQQSNALALTQLKLALSTEQLSTEVIAQWLLQPHSLNQVQYPNVASAICDWLLAGCNTDVSTLSQKLWR
ncbi:MAG: glycosyltransferase [Gammaproteobacteria bacterium]|nr:glycosyltransferase [Gammaproteobacteria bacterium]MBU1555783.1 glycosyltransferase [Gammaproteobacteria bacterium]MBU2069691.1 glycosyltransferase [Gammaproteobacteria bacterium]MBU2184556.1 glycosyltransferase [Gammaproteobacteria bacterium]MBU2205238.1 glycosyltransferase [Gammaproteobacteria bacterium]